MDNIYKIVAGMVEPNEKRHMSLSSVKIERAKLNYL